VPYGVCVCVCVCVHVCGCHKTGAFGSFWDTHYPTDFGIPIIKLCVWVYVYVCHKTGAFGIPIIQLIHENLTASAAPSDAAKNKVELPKSQHATRFTI